MGLAIDRFHPQFECVAFASANARFGLRSRRLPLAWAEKGNGAVLIALTPFLDHNNTLER